MSPSTIYMYSLYTVASNDKEQPDRASSGFLSLDMTERAMNTSDRGRWKRPNSEQMPLVCLLAFGWSSDPMRPCASRKLSARK